MNTPDVVKGWMWPVDLKDMTRDTSRLKGVQVYRDLESISMVPVEIRVLPPDEAPEERVIVPR